MLAMNNVFGREYTRNWAKSTMDLLIETGYGELPYSYDAPSHIAYQGLQGRYHASLYRAQVTSRKPDLCYLPVSNFPCTVLLIVLLHTKAEAHAFSRWLRFLGRLLRGKLLQACCRQTP